MILIPGGGGRLRQVTEDGRQRELLTRVDTALYLNHRWPQFLPDGHQFLLFAQASAKGRSAVMIGSLESPEVRRLFDADSPVVFMAPDRLLFVQQDTLYASRFDTRALQRVGPPVRVADQVARVSASATGAIAYRTTPGGKSSDLNLRLTWFDRLGNPLMKLPEMNPLSTELSPDDTQVAMQRLFEGDHDIWLQETTRGTPKRLPSEGRQLFPAWSPDGERIVYSDRTSRELRVRLASGVGPGELLLDWEAASGSPETSAEATDWSEQGYILFNTEFPRSNIFALPVTGDGRRRGEWRPVANNPSFRERHARFSQDGNWIAYESNENGRFEIFLKPFPALDRTITITSNGGTQVRWGRKGKELLYLAPDGTLMAVPLTFAANGKDVTQGVAKVLFPTNLLIIGPASGVSAYDVSSDGNQILMFTSDEEPIAVPIKLILNWKFPSN